MDFNKAEALDRVEGDWDFYLELVSCFFSEYPTTISKIKDSASKGNAAELGMLAHTIKGALGNLSAINARELAFQLERLGKTGSTSGSETLIIQLEDAVSAYKNAVDASK